MCDNCGIEAKPTKFEYFLLEILQNLANQVENENPASDSQKGLAGQTKRVEKQTPKIIHTALKI
jgi:hypothetical protein